MGAIGIETVVQGLQTEQIVRVHVLAVIACKGHNRRIIMAVLRSMSLVAVVLFARTEAALANARLLHLRIFILHGRGRRLTTRVEQVDLLVGLLLKELLLDLIRELAHV